MRHVNVTDEWLYEHMPYADEAMIKELEQQTDTEYPFSGRFDRKMKKMLRKGKRRKSSGWKTRFQSGIAVAACIGIVISITGVSVYAGKISFFETIKTVLEDSFLYSYRTETEPEEIKVRKPGYVPPGYIMVSEEYNDDCNLFAYQNDKGEQLVCQQLLALDGSEIVFDSEYDKEVQIEIAGGTIYIYRYLDGYAYCYMEYGNSIFMLDANSIGNREIEKIYVKWVHG